MFMGPSSIHDLWEDPLLKPAYGSAVIGIQTVIFQITAQVILTSSAGRISKVLA